MTQHIDYVTTYFPHKTPTLVRGEPTFNDLKRIKTELRADASSVESDVGGGDHGYLFLVLSDAEYTSIPGITATAVAPTWPGTLTIDPTFTQIEVLQAHEQHQESICVYRECQNVEKALLNHLQRSLEPQYLQAFVDDSTALLTGDIPVILEHLYNRYGIVRGEDVKSKEAEVLKLHFTPSEPLVLIWNPIEKLKKLAQQANLPYSEQQLIEFALHIIRGTHDFEKALGDWHAKAVRDKTWTNLKAHFALGQDALKAIRGPTMAQAGFHQINMIANDIRDKFTLTRAELANLICSLDDNEATSVATPTVTSTTPSEAASHNFSTLDNASANSMNENSTQFEMLKLLRTMQAEMIKLNTTNSGPNTSFKPKKKKSKTPDNPTFTRRITNLYCWTHGGCAHAGNTCNDKAPGHKNEATFDNKMEGSKAFCP